MKKPQNLAKIFINQPQFNNKRPERKTPQTTLSKGVFLSPKFNRKQEFKNIGRKKPDISAEKQQRICFISPSRTLGHSPSSGAVIQTQKHSMITDLLEDSNEGSRFARHPSQNLHWAEQVLCLLSERQDTGFKDQVPRVLLDEKMREQIENLKLENKRLRGEVVELQWVKEFLMEREKYIGDLSLSNSELCNKIANLEGKIVELEGQISRMCQNFELEKNQLNCLIAQTQNKNETQLMEIEQILKMNLKLQEYISQRSEINVLGENVMSPLTFNKKTKENHLNWEPSHSRKLIKSKSHFLQKIGLREMREKRLTYESSRSQQLSSIPKLNESELQCKENENSKTSINSEELIMMNQGEQQFLMEKQNNLQLVQNCNCQQSMKRLKQKIRYSQIEIDILKRMKLDAHKVKEDNQKIKKQNRKLLTRIDYLTQNHQRDSRDESFELSLSPQRN